MLSNGLLIMVVGMGVVFSFLTIIYYVVLFYTRMVQFVHAKFGIDESEQHFAVKKNAVPAVPVQVISAAVAYYYRNN